MKTTVTHHITLWIIGLSYLCVQTIFACYPPIAHGSYINGILTANTVITFTGTGTIDNSGHPFSSGGPHRWYWDFDYNGTFSADLVTPNISVTHNYTQDGTYSVAVRYVDDDHLMSTNTYIFTIVIKSLKRYYYVKDHLGSVRVTVDQAGAVVGYDDYDPWGYQLAGRCSNSGNANDKNKFTGKERDVETGYDYFGARYYDSRIGRWLAVDPLLEKYPNLSPYNYTGNNPIGFIDPNGKYTKTSIGGVQLYSRWTTEQADQNMKEQTYVGYGIYAFAEQLLRNDPSYRPSHQDLVSTALIEMSSHHLGELASGILGLATSVFGTINYATQGLSKTEMYRLAVDAAIFEGALNEMVDGIPLAVKAGIGEGGKIVEDPKGNGTLMILNPKLKKKWGDKSEEKFDEKLHTIKQNFLARNYRIFDSRRSNDPNDTSSGFNAENK